MTDHANFDEGASKRTFTAPYSSRHPVPTVQGYEAQKEEREAESEATAPVPTDSNSSPKSRKRRSLLSSAKSLLRRDSTSKSSLNEKEPYKAENHNVRQSSTQIDDTRSSLQASSKEELRNKETWSEDDVKVGNGHEEAQLQEAPKHEQQHEEIPPRGGLMLDGKPRQEQHKGDSETNDQDKSDQQGNGSFLQDSSQAIGGNLDPRQKRKNMKHMSRDHTTREVTDPVTHLPVMVHDSTNEELKSVSENEPPPGSELSTADNSGRKTKSETQLQKETNQQQLGHRALQKLFPPPDFDAIREQIAGVYGVAITVGLGSVLLVPLLLLVTAQCLAQTNDHRRSWLNVLVTSIMLLISGLTAGGCMIYIIRGWLQNRIYTVWDDQLWEAARKQEIAVKDAPTPESVQWLNSLLASVWGLINPDLFTSLVDTLEDVMQASLPKLVRMISVEDLGQGSEAIRILGVRWLPTAAAAKDVSKNGKIKPGKGQDSDRKVSGEGEIDNERKDDNDKGYSENQEPTEPQKDEANDTGDNENIAEGMEAEEGDFVNIEVAFSYRASASGRSLTDKSKNAHLYLGFYLPGGIKFPVWVELRGIVGTMRMRLQLCPDPPFFALCTLTLLGQPKADISCVPLTKKGLNIMDLPLISSFVQSSIDAALAEYVAPKSLTLDLKDMLVGDDFKKDTSARGVLMVRIKQAREFKEGDSGMVGLKQGSSDAYVAIGWAKFGKPVWSTRVIVGNMQPVWEETTFVLVSPEEINAEERLRVQLWDSDRTSADDDLGGIEVNLKELMSCPHSKGRMWDRTDSLQASEGNETMPGTLDWSVGYFAKMRIQPEQLKRQNVEPEIHSISDLKEKVSRDAERKLREAKDRDESPEVDQQKAQDLKLREGIVLCLIHEYTDVNHSADAMIIATPPLREYPTGIFSIQIHYITGLEYEQINKNRTKSEEGDDSEEGAGDLPSSYCTVILNHKKVFKTRTKPKNAKPFFNAGTERLIRDWRTTEIMVSVRDSRVHENDPLLGIIYLPLGKVFQERSQVIDSYPLVGGIGYGKARVSLVFRSIQLQAPKNLLGWDYGTIQITGPITSKDISPDLHGLRMKLRTVVNRGKMYASQSAEGSRWTGKHGRLVHLAVRKRYCSCMVIEFRKNSLGLDKTPAFGILWLKNIPDEEDVTVRVPVWRTDKENLQRGETNCVQELGEKLGTLAMPLKFYRGLGGYHQKLASKSPSLQDVFEVLSTANDNKEAYSAIGGDYSSSEDSDSSDDDSQSNGDGEGKSNGFLKKMGLDSDSNEEHVNDGKGGPIDQIKNYKLHSDQLHRRHRGLMQWKGARTADWVKTKVEHGKDHLLDNFRHHERNPGVETEV
ncbi:MAG: hypothetical protein Q9217_003769 [Psora testacea]